MCWLAAFLNSVALFRLKVNVGNPSTHVTLSRPNTIITGKPTSISSDPIRVSATRCIGAGKASAIRLAARCVVVRRLVRLLDRAMDLLLLAA